MFVVLLVMAPSYLEVGASGKPGAVRHAWLKHVDRTAIDLGSGKRMLVKDGRYDPTYEITVPKELAEAY